MKIYLSILIYLLCSCSNSNEKTPENICAKTTFKSILKEIHLAEAAFELNKAKNIEDANNKLGIRYFHIYKKHQVSEMEFKKTLDYYSKNPKKLEQIYADILAQLTKEKSTLYQQ